MPDTLKGYDKETKICFEYKKTGKCSKGDNCPYLHVKDQNHI